jgi:hypothetical protein
MCRSFVLFSALVLVFGALTFGTAARADPPTPTPTPASEQLADEGYKLRVQNRDAEALEKFQAAYQLRAAPRYLVQIALAEQALGRWSLAHEHLAEALREQRDPWVKKWNTDLQATLATLKHELATLEITCNVPGTAIVIAEREVGRTPLAAPLYVAAGTIAVDLRADGYLPVSHVVNTVRGQLSRLDVTLIARTHPGATATASEPAVADRPAAVPPVDMYQLAPQVEAQPTSPPSVDTAATSAATVPSVTVPDATVRSNARRRDLRWLYYGAGGGAAVALIGGITYAVAGKKTDKLEQACYDQSCDDDELRDRRQNVRALDRASWGLIPLGIAAMLGSGAAYYWWPAPASERQGKSLQVNATGDASRVMVHGKVEF